MHQSQRRGRVPVVALDIAEHGHDIDALRAPRLADVLAVPRIRANFDAVVQVMREAPAEQYRESLRLA